MLRELEHEPAKLELRKQYELANPGESAPRDTVSSAVKGLLPKMDNDDPLAFFHIFERTLEMHDVDRSKWCLLLPACLSAKATKVYSGLTLEQCQNYDLVKKTVLMSYRLTAKSYRDCFKTMRRTGQESYVLFLRRLTEMQRYFLQAKEIDSFDKLVDEEILEQFIESLSPAVREFVVSRQPDKPSRAAELADLCFQVGYQGRGGVIRKTQLN